MLKKLTLCVLIGGFFNLIPPAPETQAGNFITYGGGKVLIGDQGAGGGAFITAGYQFSKNLIGLGGYGAEKTGEGDQIDHGYAGFLILSDPIFGSTWAGIFFNVTAGAGHVEGIEGLGVETLTNAGFFLNLDKEAKTRFYLGAGYHYIDKTKSTTSIHFGVSIKPDF